MTHIHLFADLPAVGHEGPRATDDPAAGGRP
jgi:hypothetical protein